MKYIILDFEVFKYDVLLGTKIITAEDVVTYQTWDKENIKKFYEEHKEDLWIGHNNIGYDNVILEGILKNRDVFDISKKIVNGIKLKYRIPLYTYDTMRGFYSLKATEMVVGKNISETPIDFDLDRPLTDQEKKQIEQYNRDDLDQTHENFIAQYDEFSLRLDLISEFGLSLNDLNFSEARLGSLALHAKQVEGIEDMAIETKLPPTIQLKNQKVIDFYLNEDFRKKKSIKVNLCNCEHIIASGGIHAALKKVHFDNALYFDVSGYYNLIMINYDLLPRTMSEESKKLYEFMYHEQLRLKKINPRKRAVYKTILLCVFGAMSNKYTDFYDPYKGSLVTIVGEIFLVDLLEKLEGFAQVIQSNTDGIILIPLEGISKEQIIKIVEEWEQRTGFVIKKEEIHNLWQRDVNNYMFDNQGTPVVRGEIVNTYGKSDAPVLKQAWQAKEPEIIARGIVDYLIYNIPPEKTVEKYKRNLVMFQYACKTMSFDYCQYETIDQDGNKKEIKLQNINRAFASNDPNVIGTVIKYKTDENGKLKQTRIQSLPKNVFIYNDDIREESIIDRLSEKIDYQYYIDRIWERCGEFVE